MFKRIPLYIFLMPVFVIIHVAADFRGLIKFGFVWPGIVKIFLAQLCLFLFSRFFSADLQKRSLLTFVFSLIYFFFSDAKDYLYNGHPHVLFSSYSFLLPLIALLLIISVVMIRRSKTAHPQISRFLNLLLILSIAADIPSFFGSASEAVFQKPVVKYNPAAACDSCENPDVYFLLFDAFTSNNVLKSTFGFDNSSLDSFLSRKGFYVMAESRSNYALTPLSVSSCFDMNYLKFRKPVNSVNLKTYLSAVDYIDNTEVPRYFAAKGYDIVNESIFNVNGIQPKQVPYDIWDQHTLFSRKHFFQKIYNDLGWHFSRYLPVYNENASKSLRERRDADLDASFRYLRQTIADTNIKPKFVYAHFLLPHGPYSRDADGKVLPYDLPDTEAQEMKSYVMQVQYASGIIRSLVNEILIKTKRPVVIMVIGDHGYRFGEENKNQLDFPNLNAVYFTNKNYSQFRQNQSLVNNFRVVLNSCFGESLPLLKDSSIFLTYK